MTRSASHLNRAVADHRAAIERFTSVVERVEPERWGQPRASGKWSPAQIAEHLVLYYAAATDVLDGAPPLRPRAGRSMRAILRWFLLPHILFHRSIPLRAAAPREIRPSTGGLPRDEVLEALPRVAAEFESAVARPSVQARVMHPYFGEITPLRFLRFSTVHVDHHRKQLESSA